MTSPLTQIGDYASQIGAEIVAFDDVREFLYVVSGGTVLQVLEFSDPTTPREVVAIDLADYGVPIGGANSIAYRNGLVAIAVQAANKTDPGWVGVVNVGAISTAADIPAATKVFTVGALPDMVTFTPDGTKVLVANEGEPDGSVDPEGSISIIDVSGDFAGLSQANVATANFQGFNAQKAALQASGVRIFPDATVAQDVEPEYIAVSPDGTTAFVTLQENNAIAIVDIATATVTGIKPLGLKDFSLAGNGIDASDRDGGINIKQQPVFGLYMPDSIAAFEVNGQTYYVIANEGDDRGDADAIGRGDAIRLKDISKVISLGRNGLTLDPALIATLGPDALKDENLGRLTISSIDGDTDGDGDLDKIVAYGGRSFSVLDSAGNMIFDSGDQLEQITAQRSPDFFNANDGLADQKDTRSDNKGPEPEAITTGIIDGKPYAFIGLERAGGGVLMYDLSNPTQPQFIQYIRDDKDVAPEGFQFIAANQSPTGQPLLVAANEVSKTVAVYQAPLVIDSPTMAPTVSFNRNNLLATTGNGTTQLKATLTGRTSETVGEIIVIATDDENGTIDGKAPGSAGYQAAALARATVVLSTLSASEFGGLNPMRTIDVMGGKFLQFATIKGGTLGDVINGRGGEIIFATPAANSNGQSAIANPNALNNQSVQVSFRLPGSSRNDITLDLTLGDTPKPLGSEIQGENAESEIIDLTGIAAPSVNATVEVFREASFNNVVGFYGIEDKAGTVIDPLTGNSLKPGDVGYVKAALANRVDLTLTGENGRNSQFSATLATGKLLSTFLVVDGTIDALLDNNPANDPTIYFNHIGMNSDGKDHVRLLGDNIFGFEDLSGGGDMDFDDVIVKMSFA